MDIASCGNTKKEAIEGLKNAIEAYLEFMISEDRENEIYRPVPMDEYGKEDVYSGDYQYDFFTYGIRRPFTPFRVTILPFLSSAE